MNRMFVILFCITFIVGINGARIQQPASIDADAQELAQLAENIWALKPAITHRAEPILYCELIDKCCKAEDRAKAASLMSQNMFRMKMYLPNQIMQICGNSSTSDEADHSCSSVMESSVREETLHDDPVVERYVEAIKNNLPYLKVLGRSIVSSCNSEQFQAFICSSNRKLVEQCARKVLQRAYDYDYKNYQKLIVKAKQAFTAIIQKLSEGSAKSTDIE